MTAIAQTMYQSERHLRAFVRQPWFVLMAIIQPVIWLLLFGALFQNVTKIPGFGAEGGSVINISSVASTKGLAGATVYGATKAALDQITRNHAIELAPRKIRVNTIAPGGVETEGTHSAGIIGSDFEKQMVADTPLGRLGQPDDIAGVAVFLASDASRWITGERLVASGGSR